MNVICFVILLVALVIQPAMDIPLGGVVHVTIPATNIQNLVVDVIICVMVLGQAHHAVVMPRAIFFRSVGVM